jgi:8-amino-7-oxononanoate synthase
MSRPSLIERLARQCAERTALQLARRLRTVEAVQGPHLVIGGKRLLSFASNDYLGLAQHPALHESLVAAAREWGTGATASHLLGGHRAEHVALEDALARWTGRERALVFSSGYMANLGVLGALLGPGDGDWHGAQGMCVADKLDHASLLDGARLAGCELRRYPHGDVDAARRQLQARPATAALLATDGVFSMDGDIAPLVALAELARAERALLYVDDAHGFGVVGAEGSGSVAAVGLDATAVPLLMGTLGKALGCAGAFVAGDAAPIDALAQFARSHVYTTALPPALAAAARTAIGLARHEHWRRERLALLVRHLRKGAEAQGLTLLPSATPIQPLAVGDSAAALALSAALEARGFFVPAIRPPTVPRGQARLRIALSALHAESDIERLLDALAAIRRRTPRKPAQQRHRPAARQSRRS